jgi:hypothetical protein
MRPTLESAVIGVMRATSGAAMFGVARSSARVVTRLGAFGRIG